MEVCQEYNLFAQRIFEKLINRRKLSLPLFVRELTLADILKIVFSGLVLALTVTVLLWLPFVWLVCKQHQFDQFFLA